MSLKDTFRLCYNDLIQLSPFQVKAIAGAVLSHGAGCRFLVFGVGNDTGFWLNLNRNGTTQFLETNNEWMESVRGVYPEINVSILPVFNLTVASSMRLSQADLTRYEMPAILRQCSWDVILVDAPPGNGPADPGRALSIFWAASIANSSTDVFVDDYQRELESRMADEYLRRGRPGLSTTVVYASDAVLGRQLLWSMGRP